MIERDRGTIVQVGSALAYRGIPLQSAYCSAKHALQGLTDSVRTELIHQHSRVHMTMVQLPALNTPQFEIQRNKMPRKPQPVPPIFQPEIAARAILYAAEHRRRELWVTWPTVRAVLGQRVVPGALDRFLGEAGYESQLRSEPADPTAPDALYQPVPGDHDAHGVFDDLARSESRMENLRSPLAGPAVDAVRRGFDRALARMLHALIAPRRRHRPTD
jgi:hypothetical protein